MSEPTLTQVSVIFPTPTTNLTEAEQIIKLTRERGELRMILDNVQSVLIDRAKDAVANSQEVLVALAFARGLPDGPAKQNLIELLEKTQGNNVWIIVHHCYRAGEHGEKAFGELIEGFAEPRVMKTYVRERLHGFAPITDEMRQTLSAFFMEHDF